MPPNRLFASPMDETVTSIFDPVAAKAGRRAVTMTAAMFLVSMVAPRVLTPMRSIIEIKLCWVMGTLRRLSPVPLRPTTNP